MGRNDSLLEKRIRGTFSTRYWVELFANSAHFPIANILFELLHEEPADYLLTPELYVLILASLIQAYWLTRWQDGQMAHRLFGNLIGPAVYTVAESLLEGGQFFTEPQHIAYWGYSLILGILQSLHLILPGIFRAKLIVLENVTRASILFFMYAVFEMHGEGKSEMVVADFYQDPSHQFIGLAVLFLGLSIGLANVMAERYLEMLRETSGKLKVYSEWLLGRELLGKLIKDSSALGLARRERTVLFMDIRNFTHWSGGQTPEAVVGLLNRYYEIAEPILEDHRAIKFKLSADEVMAIFPTVDTAFSAAQQLCVGINRYLGEYGLGAGIGIHAGQLVEGLLGSAGIKFYDVIGDTVNTAKRIEGAAGVGEVLLSEEAMGELSLAATPGTRREISVKGKEHALIVYVLEAGGGSDATAVMNYTGR